MDTESHYDDVEVLQAWCVHVAKWHNLPPFHTSGIRLPALVAAHQADHDDLHETVLRLDRARPDSLRVTIIPHDHPSGRYAP